MVVAENAPQGEGFLLVPSIDRKRRGKQKWRSLRVVLALAAVDVGYPRDAPATVLFGEWFRFGKPNDQKFLFEKTVSPTASNSSSIPKKHSKQPSLELLEQLPILEPAKIHPRPKVPKLPLVVVVTFYPVFPDPYAVIHETILLNLNNNNQIKPITYQKAFSSGIRSSNNPAKKFMAYTRLASMYVPGNSQQRGYV
ncbi:hypothetical protein LXL04_003548 [Taraxacum kok-saghyz]